MFGEEFGERGGEEIFPETRQVMLQTGISNEIGANSSKTRERLFKHNKKSPKTTQPPKTTPKTPKTQCRFFFFKEEKKLTLHIFPKLSTMFQTEQHLEAL